MASASRQVARDISIRDAKREDIEQGKDLIVRMKRLNGEMDPLFKEVGEVSSRATTYLSDSLGAENVVLMVAVSGKRVIGIVRGELRDRYFYEPSKEGHITDFYVMPEARRKSFGVELLDQAGKKLKAKGAEMITAEFPAQNEIAVSFYRKNGFRALLNVYAREGRS